MPIVETPQTAAVPLPTDSTLSAGQRQPEPHLETEERKENFAEAVASIATVLVVGLFAMGFIFQNFVIPSGSMEKTLLVGDHVFVDRITFAPPTAWAPFVHYRDVRRGDVVVFYKPNPESPDLILVKRTIGLPGDHIHLRHGVVYLNGVAQNEPYAAKVDDIDPVDAYDPRLDDFPANGAPPSSLTTEVWTEELPSDITDGELVVPAGKIFVMGDNRHRSADGRFWGFVPRANVLGRPLFNYWSFEEGEQVETDPALGERLGSYGTTAMHFFDKTRWKRTLHLIR